VYVDRIVVDDNYQNLRIGSMLYAHLEARLRRDKIYTLCAEVNSVPPNPGSQRFHKRLGFKVVANHAHSKDYVVDMMVKQLNGGEPKKAV
jgi:hypothetical protein